MASITTFFGTQGGGGSVSGTATRVAFFGGTPGSPSTTLDDSANLEWDDTNGRLSVGDATTVASTLTVAGAGATDSTSAFEVRTSASRADLLLFRVYDNGRIDSRMLNSSEALTFNMAVGLEAGSSLTTGNNNCLLGFSSATLLTSGGSNVAVGVNSLLSATTSSSNTAIGNRCLESVGTTGENVAIGVLAGSRAGATGTTGNTSPTQCTYIGNGTRSISGGNATNEIVIGYGAVGNGSNSVTLGHTTVTNTYLRGDIHLENSPSIYFSTVTGTSIGSAPTEKFSFYGVAPIVQPDNLITSATVVHGSGQAVKDDSTFGGYTIGQIVKALQTLGLLA